MNEQISGCNLWNGVTVSDEWCEGIKALQQGLQVSQICAEIQAHGVCLPKIPFSTIRG